MFYVYYMIKEGNDVLVLVFVVMFFVIGFIYLLIIRRGFNVVIYVLINLGEFNVWNKIKNLLVMIEY